MHEPEPCFQLFFWFRQACTRKPLPSGGKRSKDTFASRFQWAAPGFIGRRDEPRATAQLEERRWHVVGDGLLKFAPFVLIYPLWHAKSRVVTCGQCYVGT